MNRILGLQRMLDAAPAEGDSSLSAGLCSSVSGGLCSTSSAGLCGGGQ